MKRTLAQIQADYETVLHSDAHDKDIRFAQLMSELEKAYNIPMMRSEAWEKENRSVIALYRKISLSRSFD